MVENSARLCYNIYRTPISQAAGCLLNQYQLSFKKPLLSRLALGLASLAATTDLQGLSFYPAKERRQTMTRLIPSEQKLRNEMLQQGMLWCVGCKQFHPVKDFRKYRPKNKGQSTNYGYRRYCCRCEKLKSIERRSYTKEFARERNTTLKAKFVEYAGGCCQRCGYNTFYASLDFHHVYPANKEYNPAHIIYTNNFEKAWKELDKCCLLCQNCHTSYEAELWKAEFIKRDGLGWTVAGELPLDDTRYQAERSPIIQQAPLPLFASRPKDAKQLRLFEGQGGYAP